MIIGNLKNTLIKKKIVKNSNLANNSYSYAANSPILIIDPIGLWELCGSWHANPTSPIPVGAGGSLCLGKDPCTDKWFLKARGGIGFGGGLSGNYTGAMPGSPAGGGEICGSSGYLGFGANIGGSLLSVQGGWSGTGGIAVGDNAQNNLTYDGILSSAYGTGIGAGGGMGLGFGGSLGVDAAISW